MRLHVLVAFLFLTSASVAWARDDDVQCNVEAGPNDRVAKGQDVVVEENASIHDAVAVDGNVIIKKGATVRSAIALHGSVTVEPGAHVKESVVAIGGKTTTTGAKIDGSVIALGRGIHVRGENGSDFDLDLKIGGKDLANEILRAALKDIRRCKITTVADSDSATDHR